MTDPQQNLPVLSQPRCAGIPAGFTSLSTAGTGIASCSGANGFSAAFGAGAGSFFGVAGFGVGFLMVAGVLGFGVAVCHH